ncbi:peptidoglycan bridge formation glycyltransferase FemA/FemB family protein [Pseudogracilibacillus auburnensis]|uniref:peptidoglycan bridge formation glycyltransferase FemA/FemB family protein n=1 Tax=Pseudogracilibacillus auburnensis TaxID=1494959 RepID=UPI001A9635EB|nr:peptidoglycan bridge formation glycyltransferase FemA/FemB family protein [Pseudogracilibacillus auburnensis]MBO1001492.1 hypothetical protein [Pseudogracilibacillus auburnensis]
MVIQWKKYIFTLNEIYEDEEVEKGLPKADLHAYFMQKELCNFDKWYTLHKQVLTLCIDLNKTEDELRKEMNRTTRYQINKAGRDGLSLHFLTEPKLEDIEQFTAFFNPFAREKGIELCRVDKLMSLRKNGRIVISYVCHPDGRKLASHVYILTKRRAIMLYSCSGRFANADIPGLHIGRANRYLHWNDILFFKERNFQYYDFLGLSINMEDKAQQNVNTFKKGFGGFEKIEYQSFVPQNWRGKILVLALRVMWRNQLELIHGNKMPVFKYLANIEEK